MKLRIAVFMLALSSMCWGEAKSCPKKPPVPPPPTPVTGVSNVNTNTNTNSSSSTSSSTSSASASSKQSQGQQQGQTQTATGGNAAGGNASTINSTETKVAASAIAPPVLPTVPCFKGAGGAAQVGMVGGSFGGGKVDQGCDDRELARSFSGPQTVASCKILIATKKAKKAGITLEDCLGIQPIVAQPIPDVHDMSQFPEPVIVPPVIVVVQPPLVLPTPTPAKPVLKRKPVRHLRPDCQNVMQTVCATGKPDISFCRQHNIPDSECEKTVINPATGKPWSAQTGGPSFKGEK